MYSKNAIRIYSFLISIVVTFCVRQCSMKIYKVSQNIKEQIVTQEEVSKTKEIKDIKQEIEGNGREIQETQKVQSDKEIWQLMIPKIDLIAPIEEGTEQSTMKKAIGHFNGTETWEGNIGLAAHNRGTRSNFFENIKQLVKGDVIIYQKGEEKKQYIVDTVAIISEEDWSYLQNTIDNRITLITCVVNQPSYRLCIQGKES